ncbi:MAG: tetratricopeptide repeat protein [Bacteroidota bacterium]|nr:tetratricopeptide repeat protein [Bacteroidota bacterium]
MSYRFLLLFFLAAFAHDVNAQDPIAPQPIDGWKNTRKGNESFKKKDFGAAEKFYKEGAEKDTSHSTANYNLGNALYRQKKYEDAERAYASSTGGNNPDSLSKSWHNLGNAMLQQKKYQESINAYKQSLKLNPNDEQTRYNLAYAQSKLKAQQPPPKQGQNQKNQKQQQNQKQTQAQNSNQPKPPDKNQKAPPDQQESPSMSKNEAERMLDALKDQEKKTRDRMNTRKNKSLTPSNEKDW